MAQDLEASTKNLIRSLLTSSPLVLTIRKLASDFRNTIGDDIPFHRMGYNSLEHFLKSIPDTVYVNGNGPLAQVLPVITEKTAHINEMVTRQKTKAPATHFQGKRHFIPSRKKIQYPKFEPTNKPVEKAPVVNVFKESPKQPVYSQPVVKEPVSYQPDSSRPVTKSDVKSSVNPQNSVLSKPVSHHKSKSSSHDHTKPKRVPGEGSRLSTNNAGKNSKLTVKNVESYVSIPETLQNQFKMVIARYDDGIWCSDLPYCYKQVFNKKLDYESHGYRRLIDMCLDLPDIFHCIQPDMGDFKLYDKRKPLPKDAESKHSFSDCAQEVEDEYVCQLNWIDCSPLIPEDVCKLGFSIPRQFVSDTAKENDQIGVVVVEIYDPSKFWIYLSDSPLDDMMNEMQTFYQASKDQYLIPQFLLVEGLYCTQIIYGEYHRALIVDPMPHVKGFVKLLYIDYGTLTKASSEGICFLHKKFATLPWQQIRCRLANIVPVEDISPWPVETIQRFKNLIKNRDLQAKISSIDREEKILEIFLADVTDEKIFYINDVLVDEGLAVYSSKVNTNTLTEREKRLRLLKMFKKPK